MEKVGSALNEQPEPWQTINQTDRMQPTITPDHLAYQELSSLQPDKKCNTCLTVKPLSEFYRHRNKHQGKCKKCRLIQMRERFKELWKRPDFRAKIRASSRSAHDKRAALGKIKSYRGTPEQRRKWRETYRKLRFMCLAQQKARTAVKKGMLFKPDRCEVCGRTGEPIEGHHADYSKPLVVTWLCRKCHGQTRRKPDSVP